MSTNTDVVAQYPIQTDGIQMPNEATQYILLQRIDTQEWNPSNYLPTGRSELLDTIYSKVLLNFEASMRHDEIADQYLDQIQSEFETFKSYLPDNPEKIVDIGCGVAGFDLFLASKYFPDIPDIYLFDKTKVSDTVYYKFEDEAAFYNSLDAASNFLTVNGVPAEKVHTVEANQETINEFNNVDLFYSIISWGFHYPVDTYIESVVDALKPSGKVLLDIRKETERVDKHTNDMAQCNKYFDTVDVIQETRKYKRTLLSEPKTAEPQTPTSEKEPVALT